MTVRRSFGAATGRYAAVAIFALAAISFGSPASVSFGLPPTNTVDPSRVTGDVGDVVLLAPDGDPLRGGDRSTPFIVRLPEGAACPGDSANDQWRVNTFLIPIEQNPLDVLFGSSGPEPPWTSGMYPLFDNRTNLPIVFSMLRRNPAPGSPGLIESVPETGFSVVSDNQFPGGNYRLGISCQYFAQTTQYWDTELIMSAAPDVTWELANPTPTPDGKSKTTSQTWIWFVAAGGLLMFGLFVWNRRRTTVTTTSNAPANKAHPVKSMTKESL